MSQLLIDGTYTEIAASPTPATLYYGNPSICTHEGNLVASYTLFGPSSYSTYQGGTTEVRVSTDDGATWGTAETISGISDAAIFTLEGDTALYLIGRSNVGATNPADLMIAKKPAGGSWTTKKLLAKETQAAHRQNIHPLVIDGFLVIATEGYVGGVFPPTRVGVGYCSLSDDIFEPADWTFTAFTADATGYLEFSVVPDLPSGFQLLGRRPAINKGVRVPCTWDSGVPSLSLGTPVIYDQLGGDVMWQVAYHPVKGKYYALCNPHTNHGIIAGSQRNYLELIEAADLEGPWTPIRTIASYHEEDAFVDGNVGLQYACMLKDNTGRLSGDDLKFVLRVGWDGQKAGHDSNRIWYHTVPDGFTPKRKQWTITKATTLSAEITALADGDLPLSGAAAHNSAGYPVMGDGTPSTTAIAASTTRADGRYYITLDEESKDRALGLGYFLEI